jgi:hypothetical protein
MPPIDEPASFGSKAPASEGRKPKTTAGATEPPTSTDLVALTLDVATGRIVNIERVDGAGARHELSEAERARLAASESKTTLQHVIEQAFEAGIDCLLGDASEAESQGAEDAELSRLLLRSLIETSPAKRLMQGDVLSRAIVGTLIEHAASLRAGTPDTGVAH